MQGDNYTVDWTNEDVANAIKAFFINQSLTEATSESQEVIE
jgi:hypothetical protein